MIDLDKIEAAAKVARDTFNYTEWNVAVQPATVLEMVERIRALESENARLKEALTPSGDTKADYMGEFKFSYVVAHDNEGNAIYGHIYVPWTTIKEIMARILNRAAKAASEQT